MFKKTALTATLVLATFALAGSRLNAQTDSAKSTESEKTAGAYRLDYTLSEVEEGKKINTRQYSMHSRSGDWSEIKIGSRVPVETKGDEWQYLDVGTNIRCRLADQADAASMGGSVSLSVHADLSNFAMPEQQGQSMHPTIRQIRIEASTLAPLNKPTVIGVVDDPNSKRQYQLEVTVTKLK
jgi:hypothetical protein